MGAGMSAWASRVRPSPSEQPGGQRDHFTYQTTPEQPMSSATHDIDRDRDRSRDLDQLYSSPPMSSQLQGGQAPSHSLSHQEHGAYVNKVSPDSVTYNMREEDNYFSKTQHQHQHQHHHHKQKLQQPAVERFSLSPQQQSTDHHSGAQQQKGFYDGVLDPRLLAPSTSPQSQLKTHSPSTQYIAGITRSDRQPHTKPAAYSWQLEDFGRETGEQ